MRNPKFKVCCHLHLVSVFETHSSNFKHFWYGTLMDLNHHHSNNFIGKSSQMELLNLKCTGSGKPIKTMLLGRTWE